MATPERSLEQRMEALGRAHEVRAHRAELKRNIIAGRRTVADVISAPPEYAATMKAFDVIVAAPKFGRVKADRALAACRISPSKTLGGLTDRQRNDLVDRLRAGESPADMAVLRAVIELGQPHRYQIEAALESQRDVRGRLQSLRVRGLVASVKPGGSCMEATWVATPTGRLQGATTTTTVQGDEN